MKSENDTLARLLFLSKYRSRRAAKREIREAGGRGTAEELNALLTQIHSSPDRERIEHLADELGAAHRAAEDAPTPEAPLPGIIHDDWMVGEGVESRRIYMIYVGHDTSFIGEIFDSIHAVPVETETYQLDEGQFLGNIVWLDTPPAERERFDLFEIAREKLRVYDAMQARDLERMEEEEE